jgi:hypothetical protein
MRNLSSTKNNKALGNKGKKRLFRKEVSIIMYIPTSSLKQE